LFNQSILNYVGLTLFNFNLCVTNEFANTCGRRQSLFYKEGDGYEIEYPPENWAEIEDFKRFNNLLNGIVCVNDVAERNVQNVLEYAEYSQDPERRDRVVKVVNSHRELFVAIALDGGYFTRHIY
jgi:hypothetical protein